MNLKQLSHMLQLSQTTVSRALNGYPEVNEDTRRRVMDAAKRHGYRPNPSARRLATGKAGMIGYVMPTGASVTLDPHFVEFWSGMGDYARAHEFDLVLSPADADDEEATYRRVVANKHVDAVYVSAPTPNDRRVALLKPETYMNESGRSIAKAAAFFKVAPESLLVVHDDVDLEEGRLQVRHGGGLAGHNGLRSIADALGTRDFSRLRIGVGRPERGDPRPVADYVLSPFPPETDVQALVERSADAVEAVLIEGLDAAQRRFN